MTKKTPGTRYGPGYVYALAWPAGQLIKVGGTANLRRRLGELRTVYKPLGTGVEHVTCWTDTHGRARYSIRFEAQS